MSIIINKIINNIIIEDNIILFITLLTFFKCQASVVADIEFKCCLEIKHNEEAYSMTSFFEFECFSVNLFLLLADEKFQAPQDGLIRFFYSQNYDFCRKVIYEIGMGGKNGFSLFFRPFNRMA